MIQRKTVLLSAVDCDREKTTGGIIKGVLDPNTDCDHVTHGIKSKKL